MILFVPDWVIGGAIKPVYAVQARNISQDANALWLRETRLDASRNSSLKTRLEFP
jgi:hypothetical protein